MVIGFHPLPNDDLSFPQAVEDLPIQNGSRIQLQSQGCPVAVVSLGHAASSGSSCSLLTLVKMG